MKRNKHPRKGRRKGKDGKLQKSVMSKAGISHNATSLSVADILRAAGNFKDLSKAQRTRLEHQLTEIATRERLELEDQVAARLAKEILTETVEYPVRVPGHRGNEAVIADDRQDKEALDEGWYDADEFDDEPLQGLRYKREAIARMMHRQMKNATFAEKDGDSTKAAQVVTRLLLSGEKNKDKGDGDKRPQPLYQYNQNNFGTTPDGEKAKAVNPEDHMNYAAQVRQQFVNEVDAVPTFVENPDTVVDTEKSTALDALPSPEPKEDDESTTTDPTTVE